MVYICTPSHCAASTASRQPRNELRLRKQRLPLNTRRWSLLLVLLLVLLLELLLLVVVVLVLLGPPGNTRRPCRTRHVPSRCRPLPLRRRTRKYHTRRRR